ncbi:MAG TPA: tryptophan 7-halogenase [Chthoniobacteraceae bacterium]|jgi:flavin-dependent dehydrogenase
MKRRVETVGIIGAGPSGTTLAILLRMKGVEVTLFDELKRPALIVGESLIPAIIPILRRLGVEEKVAAIGLYKPGVSFVFGERETIDFCFEPVGRCGLPTYAYNVPRPAFDQVLEDRATELGVKRVPARAKLERDGSDRLKLSAETLALAPWLGGKQPDLLVDASGRSRVFARLLEIGAEIGPRRDVAYFAHYTGFEEEQPRGQVIIGQLERGWSWRIPHQDRLSVGIVLNKDEAAKLGGTPKDRLEAGIERDPVLRVAGRSRQRVSEVVPHANYQLVSNRGHGPGWAMSGDAFGFVDPMLSPGLWLALRSAELLTDLLEDLPSYERKMRELIRSWMELISYYYDGRMFAMYHTGLSMRRDYDFAPMRALHRHIETQIACMASGGTTHRRYPRGLIKFMADHGIRGHEPGDLAIR